ncbi:hypothetical protein Nham_2757 [Nitrobacter hamburgensis X14]|uniref:Uncharacterized protein n=1 Tax=Nitrobacter hamburgensis (strain DSM 10229 / NCIMB 13809 / X14) TaxID=323097 RepID=Q1QJR2_NITHX|nr:hypothetical protein [Nitrobacter hamburgensis]ABE63535.1 hypothetical protein Nham_2757 [Nitrobacter hamburgensis X14]
MLIDVREAGTYRVALDSAAWIDLVRGRQAVISIAHGHGPACTGIRKIVDFPLAPGLYTLQIAANGQPQRRYWPRACPDPVRTWRLSLLLLSAELLPMLPSA